MKRKKKEPPSSVNSELHFLDSYPFGTIQRVDNTRSVPRPGKNTSSRKSKTSIMKQEIGVPLFQRIFTLSESSVQVPVK